VEAKKILAVSRGRFQDGSWHVGIGQLLTNTNVPRSLQKRNPSRKTKVIPKVETDGKEYIHH